MEKVLVITNSIDGLYSFRRELIERLLKDNYAVTIVSPHGNRSPYFVSLGCNLIDTPLNRHGTNPISDLRLFLKYLRIIKNEKPLACLTYTIKPNVYGGIASRILKTPYIMNVTGLGVAVENKGLLQKITLMLYKLAFKKAHKIFVQNEENLNFLQNKITDKNNYQLIPGSGVNLDHYRLLDYPNNETINFLFISIIMKEKGIDQYLEAAEYIKSKYSNTKFHVLGRCEDSYYLDKLHRMQDKGIIIYHGRQEDVREFHKISHCTIQDRKSVV